MTKILIIAFFLGLIYILIPVPSSIDAFSPIPNSEKSQLEGDTIQNPNIAAYFSDFTRPSITGFYRQEFIKMHWFGFFLPPVSVSHPPEAAYKYVRDQQESTFLEEYIYPLRESIFVNGYEPEVENRMYDKPSDFVGNHILYNGTYYNSKTTLRYYPSNIFYKILIYAGGWVAAIYLYKLYRKSINE